MDMNLYIMTHKKIDMKLPRGRKFLLVGAVNRPDTFGYDVDCVGDNISNKNANYCELTGLYWMIKNTQSDVIGLEHYRRFFVNRILYLFKFPIATPKQISKKLSKYDILLPKKVILNTTIMDNYKKEHVGSDIIEVGKVILEKYPEYKPSYDYIMNNNYGYFFNMFIGKREIVEGYANWLFDILFEVEKRIDISDRDNYQKRVFGFLSERMMAIYMHHNSHIKICEVKVEQIDESPLRKQLRRLKRRLVRRRK